MRLSELFKYNKERFPDLEIEIASRVIDGKDTIYLEAKTILGVNFALDDVVEETIFEDVANTIRKGLYDIIVKSQITEPKEESVEVEADENLRLSDTVVELVADEDRKVILQ